MKREKEKKTKVPMKEVRMVGEAYDDDNISKGKKNFNQPINQSGHTSHRENIEESKRKRLRCYHEWA